MFIEKIVFEARKIRKNKEYERRNGKLLEFYFENKYVLVEGLIENILSLVNILLRRSRLFSVNLYTFFFIYIFPLFLLSIRFLNSNPIYFENVINL